MKFVRNWGRLGMTSNNEVAYYLIFDTNVLFQTYEKKADFTSFSFNATYKNIIDMINQLDIYNQVVLGIPLVVWSEMEKQIIEKHDELLLTYKKTITKKIFPEYSIQENPTINYSEYIKIKILKYKEELSEGLNEVIEIPIASNSRFKSIINRAFSKLPPFEGKDKKSDKGFKDALLWESVLEFALKHPKSKIIVGGYEPTMNPKDFIEHANKIITGPCDSFWETMEQNGQIVRGITLNKRIPRYDLYDIKLNQQIIPDKKPNDIVTSINTSSGCPNNCDFCCSPLMSSHIVSKPLELVKREENFPLQKDWKQKLEAISKLDAKTYLFASSNLMTEDTIKIMKDNNVYMTCLGLEDITKEYGKNKKLDEVCEKHWKHGIFKYLSFIVDPLKVNTNEKSAEFYEKLIGRFNDLKPEMVCGNFLMPFKGTKLWDKYKHLVSKDDFSLYNSKSAFLEKDLERRLMNLKCLNINGNIIILKHIRE